MMMIFVNKKKDAVNLKKYMENENFKAQILTGEVEKEQRDKIIDDFRLNSFHALISTNVLARGIDIPEVDMVINYETPKVSEYGFFVPDCANYLHRIGRTGRFGTDGIGLTLLSEDLDKDIIS